MSDKFIHYKCETLVVKNPSFQVVGKVTCVDCKEVSDIQMGSINATESPKTVTIKCQHCQKVLDISSIVDDDKLDDHRLIMNAFANMDPETVSVFEVPGANDQDEKVSNIV